MKTRIVISVVALFTSVTFASAQGQPIETNSAPVDSTSIPTLAELRSAVLSSEVNTGQGQVIVPGEHRALFCRFDDKLDQKRIPLRMRLGSVEEVNRMEGKPGYTVGRQPE